MSKYKCSYCNYTTNELFNFNRHIKTKKHKSNINKIKKDYECTYCGYTTKYSSNFSKHKSRCGVKKQNYEIAYEKMKDEKTMLLEEYVKDCKKFIRGKSTPSILNEHFYTNPPLEKIDCSKFDEYIKPREKLINELLSYHRNRILHKFLGEFILSIYIKPDPQLQSLFSTDTSRLSYMIKELYEDDKSKWTLDKRGIKTSRYIIEPLLFHIKSIISEYISDIKDIKISIKEVEKRSKLLKIILDIDNGKLEKDINKNISPYFNSEIITKLIGKKLPELN